MQGEGGERGGEGRGGEGGGRGGEGGRGGVGLNKKMFKRKKNKHLPTLQLTQDQRLN